MALSQQRKGEIALIILKDRFANEGIRLRSDISRQIASDAKRLNIPEDELKQFAEEMIREAVDKMFPKKTFVVHNPDHDRQ